MSTSGQAYQTGITSVINNDYLTVRPVNTGEEIVIHNVYSEGAMELYWYDGTNRLGPFDSTSIAAGLLDLRMHATRTEYLQAKNISGTTKKMRADGMYTWPA